MTDQPEHELGFDPGPDTSGERPEWLPEQFKSPQDLAAAYQELRVKMSRATEAGQEVPEPEPAPVDPNSLTIQDNVKPPEQPTDLDFQPYLDVWSKEGQLAEEQYTELEKMGYPKQLVDGYFTGLQAQGQLLRSEVLSQAGGEQAYMSMLEWAATRMDDGWKDNFDSMMTSGDKKQMLFAVSALRTAYSKENGDPPAQMLSGSQSPAATGVRPFTTKEEMYKVMSSEPYKNPGHPDHLRTHQEVEDRLKISDIL